MQKNAVFDGYNRKKTDNYFVGITNVSYLCPDFAAEAAGGSV